MIQAAGSKLEENLSRVVCVIIKHSSHALYEKGRSVKSHSNIQRFGGISCHADIQMYRSIMLPNQFLCLGVIQLFDDCCYSCSEIWSRENTMFFVNHKASPKNHRCWFAVTQNFKVLLTNSIGSIIIMTTTWINSNFLAPEKTAVNNNTLINQRLKSLFLSKDYRTVEGMKILHSRIHQTIPPLHIEAEF